MTSFFVPGTPVPKGRPRVTSHGTFTPKRTMQYEALVRQCWREAGGVKVAEEAPVRVNIAVEFAIPKSWTKKRKLEAIGAAHISRPDLDNIIKSITDGLNGFAWADDSAICMICASKRYTDGESGVYVTIWEEDTDDV